VTEANGQLRLATDAIEFVRELYPRLREDDAAIERCRAGIDRLPPIAVARGRVLVDGYHRWQAYRRERLPEIPAEDLGNLTDSEIIRESLRRNASHGQQLSTADKERNASRLYRLLDGNPAERYAEISDLLSITRATAESYCREARREEKAAQQAAAWDAWLDGLSERAVAERIGVPRDTVHGWLVEKRKDPLFNQPPDSRQHFDVWTFLQADESDAASVFGRMPPQVVENLLWLYTEPGAIVVDPFAGGGTTILVAKAMGRRVWASDLTPATPLLPIHAHDITTGWPPGAPAHADFILLDPPYWQQAAGRYSDDPRDLGNMTLDHFMTAWDAVLAACVSHLAPGGRLAFIISPTQTTDGVVDHAVAMAAAALEHGLALARRIIVPYQTQQATGQQVEWARAGKHLLKGYRDLVVFAR
jgi:hypothetical protein